MSDQGETVIYTSPSGNKLYKTATGQPFIKTGPVGKETYVYRDVYKNLKTGELVWFNNLDINSPRPSPELFEPVTPVTGGKSKVGTKRRKSKRHTKKKSLLKLRKVR